MWGIMRLPDEQERALEDSFSNQSEPLSCNAWQERYKFLEQLGPVDTAEEEAKVAVTTSNESMSVVHTLHLPASKVDIDWTE